MSRLCWCPISQRETRAEPYLPTASFSKSRIPCSISTFEPASLHRFGCGSGLDRRTRCSPKAHSKSRRFSLPGHASHSVHRQRNQLASVLRRATWRPRVGAFASSGMGDSEPRQDGSCRHLFLLCVPGAHFFLCWSSARTERECNIRGVKTGYFQASSRISIISSALREAIEVTQDSSSAHRTLVHVERSRCIFVEQFFAHPKARTYGKYDLG